MATVSPNLALTLPESFDKVNVSVLSNNFSLIDNAFDGMIGPDEVANNLNTAGAGKVLDARQGVVLKQAIEAVEAKLPTEENVLPISCGGTEACDAATARANLGITPANIGAVTMKTTTVTLLASDWENDYQTVSVDGVAANTPKIDVSPEPDSDSWDDYVDCGVRGVSHGAGTLTFLCIDTPENDIVVQVTIFN